MPPARTRTRVIRFSGILILVLTIGTALTFLFLYQNRLISLVETEQADLVSVAYLRLLIHMQPEASELRLELAQKLRDLGRWNEARAALEPIMNQDDATWSVKLLLIDIDTRQLYALDENDPQRQPMIRELGDRLAGFIEQDVPDAYLEDMARLSLELARPDMAADLYDRLAIRDTAGRAEWLALAGRWRLASNSPKRAGQTYNEASMITADPDAAAQYAIRALEAFRAANEDAYTLSLAGAYLERFPGNRELLERAIEIARAQEKQVQALEWGKLRLALDPTDEKQIGRQRDMALEAGKLSVALDLSRKLVKLDPDNAAKRRRLAEIAEWSGNPRLALTQWLWLARRSPEGEAPARALELARGLDDDTVRIEMLFLISGRRQLEDDEVEEIAAAYRRNGQLGAGSGFLRGYLNQYPKHLSAWSALAQFLEEDGKLLTAAAIWKRIGSRFGRPIEAACKRSELLWRLDRRDEAFQLLTDVQPKATDRAVAYWKLLGEQAWELDRTMPALTAYRLLWRANKAGALEAERLIQLARDTKQPQEAATVAETAFSRFGDPRFLLLGVDAAIAADSWDTAGRLMNSAQSEQDHVADMELYWLQQALLSIHNGQHAAARAHYQRAMQLSPTSIPARVGLLWLLVETDDTRDLPVYLRRWESEAINEPAFWGVYAVALTKLGWKNQALPWYQRQAKAHPDDSALLLSYSQTLAEAGKPDAAWRLRRHIYRQLQSITHADTLVKDKP